MERDSSTELTPADRLRLEWLSSRSRLRPRRAMLWALGALLAILAFASATLYVEVARMARAAGLPASIAWQRLGEGVMHTGNLRLIRAVADLQLAVVLLMAIASWLFGAAYIVRLEALAVRLWAVVRGR